MELTQEEVQEKIELTPKQKKAFDAFIRAVNRCNKENVYFYQVLDSISALNGNNVVDIDEVSNTSLWDSPENLQWLEYPSIRVTCGWADDTHFVKLKD